MARSEASGIRIGTFDGRAGTADLHGVMTKADSKIDVVMTEQWVEESGEEMATVTLTSDLPANKIEMELELPKFSAEKLLETYT